MEARVLDENGCDGFELQQYKYVFEYSGGLFTSCVAIGYIIVSMMAVRFVCPVGFMCPIWFMY